MNIHSAGIAVPVLLASIALLAPRTAFAQAPPDRPPIHGLTGIIATPESVDQFYTDLHKLLVKSGDGIAHIRHKAKGVEEPEHAALDGLQPGTPITVQYVVKGITAADQSGQVTSVDRGRKRIGIRLSDGTTQVLRYSHHGTVDADGYAVRRSRVIVSHADESGRPVVHYFKPSD